MRHAPTDPLANTSRGLWQAANSEKVVARTAVKLVVELLVELIWLLYSSHISLYCPDSSVDTPLSLSML
jgi:hypothetical protein